MEEKVDLHSHTNYSDGILTASELVKKASERGLRALGITDHDTVEAIPEALEAAKEYDLEIIPGIEISCSDKGKEAHLLGYFVDIHNETLQRYLTFFRREREKRAERIILKLRLLNVQLTFADVMDVAGFAVVGRPHVAQAIVNRGYAHSIKDAFDKYIGPGRPAYEEKWHFPVVEGIRLINSCGGLAVIAHPCHYFTSSYLISMIESGLDGIEVVHPSHDEGLTRHYRGVATEYCLLETGGSDFHGNRDMDEANFGKFTIPYSKVDAMTRMLQVA